ncbi:hypothetical protein JCM31271_12090 [Halorubrum trueperi]
MAGFGAISYHQLTTCNEIACFSFEYQGADDAPNVLDIQHSGGQEQLPAGDVYVSEVVVDWESRETDTLTWAALADDMEPSDTIDGDEIRVRLMTGRDIVTILWRQDDDEQVIEAWVYDDDVS